MKGENTMKKKLSIFLVLIMILCMVPVNAFAANNTAKQAIIGDKNYEEATIDGVAYKVYNVADFMDEATKGEIISFMSKSKRGAHYTTQNTPTQTSNIKFVLELRWSTYDRPIDNVTMPVYLGDPDDSRAIKLGHFVVTSTASPGVVQKFPFDVEYTGSTSIDDLVKYNLPNIRIGIPKDMRYDFILAPVKWDSKQKIGDELVFKIEGRQSVMHGFGIKWFDTDKNNREKINAKWIGLEGQELSPKLATVDRNYSAYHANKIDPKRKSEYDDGGEYTTFDYYYNGTKITTYADKENEGKYTDVELAIKSKDDAPNASLTVDGKREGSKVLKNDTKYLYHSVGDYRTFHVLSMREALKVKFNTGKGSLTKGGAANQEIGKAQEIGHSEKIKDNESGREIKFPTDKLIPPEKAQGQKTENEFKGWNTDDKATVALTQDQLDALTFTDKVTTFYAIFGPKDDYHVEVKYLDEINAEILDKYKLDDETYPDTQSGDKNQEIKAEHKDKTKAPKFLGYKIKDVNVTPEVTGEEKQVYTTDGKYTVNFIYKKLDDIIPEDKADEDVKKTYKKVTIKVDGDKGKFQKNNNDVTGTEFVYYVNPVEGKTLDDVKTASGLTAKSNDENANKIDAKNPWTFDPAKTAEKTPADVALTTEVNKTNFTGDVTMEVNFGQTIAEKFKNKLKDKDIKVWKGDDITWKDGVELKTADATLQAYLDDASTSYADASTPVRNSDTAQKEPFEGTIKITFSDTSSIEVPNQKLYVSEQKVEVKDPSDPEYIDPEHLPDDKVKIEIKLGEGVKEAKDGGKEGNAANPVLVKTFYVKPNTGLAETDFPTTTGNNAEIVKQDNYKDPITWDPSELTKTFAKDETGLFVASAKSAQCTAPAVLQAEFEKAIDPMFENIKKKDGVYLGKYDKANKKVTVAIIDKTQVAKELTGTGLATGLEKLYKNNNLIKIKVGTQAERDLRDLAKRQPSSGMTLQQLFATVFGADVINEVQQTGEKTGKLADFIGKSVDLKLTVQEPDCEANAVELTYTIEGKEAISSILKGKLSPQDIKVWKGDEIDWEKGVKKDETELTDEQKEQIKDEFSTYEKGVKKVTGKAKFEDASTPARNSDTAKAEPFVGNIKVTFSDGSELLVEKQNLYVSEIMTGGNNENAPDDAITVTFQLGKGVKAKKGTEDIKGAETPVVYETYKVKPNLNLDDYKLATNKNIFDNINAESIDENKYKDVVWTPTNHVVTKTNNVFTANATEAFIMKHEFKLIDKDDNNKEIPVTDTLKKLLPKDKKVVKDETYTPDKLKDILSVNEGGKYYDYKFQGWKPASAKNEDKTFVGTWTREQAASKTPHINTPNEGDKTIGGKGVPGAEIEVEIPGVKDPIKTKVDKDGNWEVKVPGNKELKKDEKIVVTQTEDGKKPAKDDAIVGKKGGIEVEYPTSEIYVGDYKTVTPEIYGTSTTETDEAPFVVNRRKLEDMGVTVKAHSDGRLTIEIGENYRGPKRFTIDLDVYVDGQEIATYADVIVLEAKTRRPEAAVKTDDREILEHKAYIFGYPDGSVRPQGNITRAEAAAMIARLLNIEAFGSNTKPMFPDTPSAWYNRAINAVVQRGIMKGYPDGSFKPNDPITRAEFTTMIAAIDNKAYGVAPFADVKGHWAELAIGREYQAGRINGYPDGTFRPQRHITRAEAATILNKIFDRCYDAMSLIGTERKENVRIFTDLYQSFWGYNDMVEATNNHSFKRRVEGRVEEDWVMVK